MVGKDAKVLREEGVGEPGLGGAVEDKGCGGRRSPDPDRGKLGPHLSSASPPYSPAWPPILSQVALTLVLSAGDSTMVASF